MSENIKNPTDGLSDLESEIALLTREIESKRRLLEQEKGVISQDDEKDLIKQTLTSVVPDLSAVGQVSDDSSGDVGELSLDEASKNKIEELIQEVKSSGLVKAVKKAKAESAYILDTFHDVLVDHLYEELKKNRFIK